MSTFFKNKNFTKRDYECTNVVFVESETGTAPMINSMGYDITDNSCWVECNPNDINKMGCTQLVKIDTFRFYGYM